MLGQIRLGQVRLGQVRLGQVRLGQVRLGQINANLGGKRRGKMSSCNEHENVVRVILKCNETLRQREEFLDKKLLRLNEDYRSLKSDPVTGPEWPRGWVEVQLYSSMTAALEVGEGSASRPGRSLLPGKTRYPFYRRLGGPQGRSGQAEKLVPTDIRSRTVQPVAQSLYRLSQRAHKLRLQHTKNNQQS